MYLRNWSRRVLPWCVVLAWGGGLSCSARADGVVEQAQALVQQGQAQQAFRLLDADEAQRAGDPAFDAAMGEAAHAAGQYTRAIMARERWLAAQPGSLEAQVALGQSLQAAGDRRGVMALPAPVQAALIPVDAGHTLDQFLYSYDRLEAGGRSSIKGYVELGMGHDSNANAGPVVGDLQSPVPGTPAWALLPEARATSGNYVVAQAGLRGRAVLNARWSVVGTAVGAARHYGGEADRLDHTALDGTLGLAWRTERHELIASGQGSYYALDGTRLRTMGGVLGEWIYRIDGFRQWGSFVQVLDVRYPDQALRNVRRSVVGTSYSHLFRNGSSAYGGVYGGRERAQASGADALGHRLWGLRAGGQWPLAPQWSVFANADWEHRRYGGQDPFFAVTRTDRQAQLALGLNWTPSPGWRVTPQWSFTRNASTLPITDYERRVFSVTVRREF
ncbi:uncharacterized protein DUF560 [Acidovorax sp. 107]|uniref:surface lipoprotein assembly modifier n=1 Tax=Acidovorax sp. 107 TaxID=2135638 RepID=UPI000D378052|nr:surface lipoprotein assembly modifier [Acidovorax sp. 107]PUA96511.1 uncharacterized protein DUF560 [Acidovorax sp. 107]